ncbi:MAG: glycosyltransferase [Candidatus Heimdallarchaeota archaeon]|nr:MAG: glycosyltransferase [Candidatus Heimdallarchaeota archaeon]
MDYLFLFILSVNMISGILLLPYPVNILLLAISSRKWKDPQIQEYYEDSELPSVTVQLPVFNESRVIQQTLSNISRVLYPPEKLHIQILDDSTDQTSAIIDEEVSSLQKQGFNFEIIRRNSREGYKAGALANGLRHGVSEFVAIFDADFIVNPHFLERCIHYFKNNDRIGAVQTRWAHSNLHYSLFTRSMSIGLDGHFLVEKIGRKKRNAFITFNGTGGIWRRSAIEESGGWSSTTLAEDLDLAYRTQMNGYEIIYLRDVTNLQEIPPTVRCWIIQQSRWAKGFSQNFRKNFVSFWNNSQGKSRIQGTIHFTQYFVPIFIIINTSTSSLLLYFPQFEGEMFFIFGILFSIAAIFGVLAYLFAILRAKRPITNIILIPLFLFWGAGLIVRMGLGALNGLWRKGGEFVKTPKFGLSDNYKSKSISIRKKIPLDKIFIAEIVYIGIIWLGIMKALELGVSYLSQVVFYLFLLFSMINLVISEILHAISTHK